MSAALAAAVVALAAGCAGGSSTPSAGSINPAVDQATTVKAPANLQTASAPTTQMKRIMANGSGTASGSGSGSGTLSTNINDWTFIEPLVLTQQYQLNPAPWVTSCAQIDPLFGVWYLSLSNFSEPISSVLLPTCSIATPAPIGFGFGIASTKRPEMNATPGPTPTPSGGYSNLYVVQVDVSLFSIKVTPLAGPAGVQGTQWAFAGIANDITFSRGDLYTFFVANYTGS